MVPHALSSNASSVVDTGNVWHWTGTGFVGQAAHIGLFAHRTNAGGPFRNQHELGNGDDIFLTVEGRPGLRVLPGASSERQIDALDPGDHRVTLEGAPFEATVRAEE